jgi:hypothetical protein
VHAQKATARLFVYRAVLLTFTQKATRWKDGDLLASFSVMQAVAASLPHIRDRLCKCIGTSSAHYAFGFACKKPSPKEAAISTGGEFKNT